MVPNVVIHIDTIFRVLILEPDGKPLDYLGDKFKVDSVDKIEDDLPVLAVAVEVKVNYLVVFYE